MNTIHSLATPKGKAGVAIIRISGDNSLEILKKLTNIKDIKENTVKHCCIYDLEKNLIDKAVVLYFKSPKSFTGFDVVEIHCHGSMVIVKNICNTIENTLLSKQSLPGEFTKQAFINNKIDLYSSEALNDLINAETEIQLKNSQERFFGNTKDIFKEWYNKNLKILSLIEAFIDFPEEDIPQDLENEINEKVDNLIKELNQEINNYANNRIINNGFNISLYGKPNVGKSSLINLLTKKETSIVTNIEGTTRDIIQERLNINGYLVNIFDTAGIRETNNEIEKIGITKTEQNIKNSDLIIHIFDINNYNEKEIFKQINKIENIKNLIIFNKIDLIDNNTLNQLKQKFNDAIFISTLNDEKIHEVFKKIKENIHNTVPKNSFSVLTRDRQKNALKNAINYLTRFKEEDFIELKCENLRLSIYEISSITGKHDIEDILENIFNDFCIGK